METFLPSKRFATSVAVIIAIASFFFLLRNLTFSDANEVGGVRTLLATSSSEIRGSFEDRDTDGDGLYDWEEDLWGTDKDKKDTDGDGTSDYDEVEAGRHPLFKGPGDEIRESYVDLFVTDPDERGEIDSLTERLLSEYFRLRQDGELDEEDRDALVSSLFDESTVVPQSKIYNSSSLTISSDSPTSIQTYGNQLGAALSSHSQKMSTLDISSILQKGIATDNPEIFNTLTDAESLLNKLTDSLIAIPVPKSAERVHLAFINAVSSLSTTFSYVAEIENKPLESYTSLQQLEATIGELQVLESDIKNYFKSKGVTYNKGEPGFYITST